MEKKLSANSSNQAILSAAARPMRSHRTWAKVRHVLSDPFSLFLWVLTLLWLVVVVIPILQILSTSLTPAESVGELSTLLLPKTINFNNYVDAARYMSDNVVSLWRLYFNTILYTLGGLAGSLVVSVLAAYAIATMEFRGRRFILVMLLGGLVTPITALIVPEFVVIKQLHLLNTYFGIALPYIAFSISLPILILTTFFRELPREIYDAAKIDGASPFQVLMKIVLPLSRPALSACIIFNFLGLWNEFILAFVLVNKKQLINLQVGVMSMFGSLYTPWQLVAAVLVLATLPVTIIFLIFQKEFIEGLSEGALKG